MAEQIPLLEAEIKNESHYREPFEGKLSEPEIATERKAVMDSLARTGQLPLNTQDQTDLERLKAEAKFRNRERVQNEIESVVTNPLIPLDQKSEQVQGLVPLLDKESTAQEAFTESMAIQADPVGPDVALKETVLEHADEIADFERQWSLLPSRLDLDPVSSPSVWLGDLAELLVLPGTYAPPIVSTIQHAFPELTSISDNILIGDAIQLFKEELAKLPPEARLEKAKSIYDYINELEVLGVIDNDIMKVDIAQALFDSPYDADWERRLDNVIGLADYAVFGGLFTSSLRAGKAGIRAFRNLKGKPWKLSEEMMRRNSRKSRMNPSISATLDEVNPELSKQTIALMLSDESGKIAGELGTSVPEVTNEHVLFKVVDDLVRPGPDLNDDGFGLLAFSPSELDTLINGVDQAVADAAKNRLTGVGLISKYNFNLTPDGYVADVIIGASDTRGFSSLRQARAAANGFKNYIEQARNTGFERPVIMARNWAKGEYEDFMPLDEFKVGKEPGTRGEYMIKFQMEEKFTSRFAGAEGASTGEGFSGRVAKFLDKDSWAHDWFTRAMAAASDKSSLRLRQLRDTIKPFTTLNIRDSHKVLEQAQFSADNEVWLTRTDLLREWAHESDATKAKLIAGYESLRNHQQLVRANINEALYRRLEGQGAKELTLTGVDGAKIKKIATPIDSIPDDVKKVYDPEISGMREISTAELERLKQQGTRFVRFDTPLRSDDIVAHYAVVRGKNAKLDELPLELVPDTPGYFTRLYDAAYLVRELYTAEVNGVKKEVSRVVGIESNLGAADELLEQLTADAAAAGKKAKYERIRSKELEQGDLYYDPFNLEYLEDAGQLYTGSRGPEQLGKRDKVTNKRRRVLEGLASSIQASQIKASRIGAQDFLVDKLRTNWVKLYGERFGVVKTGADGRPQGVTMPWTIDQIRPAKSPEEALMRKDAIAMMEQIKLAAGIDASSTKRMVEEFMVNWSESVYKPGSRWRNAASTAILNSRNLGIVNRVKALAFFQLITMKPIRQAVLQANQMTLYLGRDDAFQYFIGGRDGIAKGTREFAGLIQGLSARGLNQLDRFAPILAKEAGMEVGEYKRFVQAYADSGLSQAIDSHLWTAPLEVQPSISGVHMGAGGMAGEYISRKAKMATKMIRRVGFDAGEQTQLMTAFLAEKNAWQKANPKIAHEWHKPIYRDQIAADARRLSLNMNSLGAMGFQNGVLSPTFQFMSHTTKTLQLMTPSTIFGKKIPLLSKFANQKVSDAEKFKMAISHTLMYGTGGYWMMTEGYEALKRELEIENAGDIDLILEEGITGTGLNLALRAIAEDPTINIEVSKSLSPLGGTSPVGNPLGKVLEYIMFQNQSLDNFAGPGWTTMKRMYKSVGVVNSIFHGVPELSTREHFEAAAKEIIRGGLLAVDDWERARFEMQLGRYMSRHGNVGLSATNTEILAKAALSLRSRADNRLRDLKLDITGLLADPLEDPALGNRVKSAAKRDADNLIRTFQLLQKGELQESDVERIVDGMVKKNQITYGGPDGTDPALGFYQAHLTSHLVNWQIETTPGSGQYELGLVITMLTGFIEGTRDEREEMFRRIEQTPDFEHKAELIEGLREQWEMD